MDDLEFRRTVYADPSCSDDLVVEAANNDPKKQEFWNELKQLDKKMAAASQVDVPSDLVHKLILRQTMQSHSVSKKRNRFQLALAASVAFAVGIGLTSMWQKQQNLFNLSEHGIAHVYHEGDYALEANEDVSLQQVNAKLARFGGTLTENVGHIYYANFCELDNIKSLHMVMQGESGKVSVFVVPHNKGFDSDATSQDDKYKSQSFDFSRASVIVVGEKDNDVKEAKKILSKKMLFST